MCEIAKLRLAPGAPRPRFEDDVWELWLADAHRMVGDQELMWYFSGIRNPAWRVLVKEVLLAMLAPRHEAVLESPLALRTVRSPRTCFRFLQRFTEWFNWLTEKGISGLHEVTQELCERYVEGRSWSVRRVQGERRRLAPETVAEHVRCIQLITLYGELLSTDAYRNNFSPWDGQPANTVVGLKNTGENRTQPVPDQVLQPLLATCLFLVEVIGPHAAALRDAVRTDQELERELPTTKVGIRHLPEMRAAITALRQRGEPLAAMSAYRIAHRTAHFGEESLRPLAWTSLARLIGLTAWGSDARKAMRPLLVDVAAEVGFEQPWARSAEPVPRADNGDLIPWTPPLAGEDIVMLADYVQTACLILTSALSGMRTSELLEIEVGSRLPAAETPGGGRRFRLSSKKIKRQRFGGVPDQWVVIEEVDRAVALAERLAARAPGKAVFASIQMSSRLNNLRTWLERTGLRAYWGLPAIPPGPVNARMLRRTLALAIAQRPGGLLAAKVHLKHISVVTTEGYTATPGGSQRLFQAEIEEAEEEDHLRLTVQAFRDAQAGILPSGPGARSLMEAFAHVDAALNLTASTDPKVLNDDRHLENLLRKQANTLHVGPANFCWFRDPSKALCLRLAGTPDADRPLVGMCDSARCPQATHHPCHRPAWAAQAATVDIFISNPRIPKGEKARLLPERNRALAVVGQIDAASAACPTGGN
ncbi:integrase [Streptomyces bobili]|uniref:integrase n=1 Tax=Streptomyces bobili TaxID=67280 RepID=UPI0034259546